MLCGLAGEEDPESGGGAGGGAGESCKAMAIPNHFRLKLGQPRLEITAIFSGCNLQADTG